jgi:hypothetical protein
MTAVIAVEEKDKQDSKTTSRREVGKSKLHEAARNGVESVLPSGRAAALYVYLVVGELGIKILYRIRTKTQ